MAASTFQTNPFELHKLLEDCHQGIIPLPDFPTGASDQIKHAVTENSTSLGFKTKDWE